MHQRPCHVSPRRHCRPTGLAFQPCPDLPVVRSCADRVPSDPSLAAVACCRPSRTRWPPPSCALAAMAVTTTVPPRQPSFSAGINPIQTTRWPTGSSPKRCTPRSCEHRYLAAAAAAVPPGPQRNVPCSSTRLHSAQSHPAPHSGSARCALGGQRPSLLLTNKQTIVACMQGQPGVVQAAGGGVRGAGPLQLPAGHRLL
jgi:hypothetical protein